MARFIRQETEDVYSVDYAPYPSETGGMFTVSRESETASKVTYEVVAEYSEKWRAENHAIAGCPCPMQWHYYHGEKHEAV